MSDQITAIVAERAAHKAIVEGLNTDKELSAWAARDIALVREIYSAVPSTPSGILLLLAPQGVE